MLLRTGALIMLVAAACSDDGSQPEGSGGGGFGASAGTATGGGGTASGGTGASGGEAGGAANVDCQALCGRVETLCVDRTDINDVWLDVCRSACDARVRVAPDTAELEQRCVDQAATCNVAVMCVASPTG